MTVKLLDTSESFILQPNLKKLFDAYENNNEFTNGYHIHEPSVKTQDIASTNYTLSNKKALYQQQPMKQALTQEKRKPNQRKTSTPVPTTSSYPKVSTWMATSAPMSLMNSTLGLMKETPWTSSYVPETIPTTTEASLDPSGRTLISFEAVLTGLVYLSFGIFLFKMIQKSLDAKKTEQLLNFLEGRTFPDVNAVYDVASNILPAIENMPDFVITKATQAIESYKIGSDRPQCLQLYICRRHLAQDRPDNYDTFFSISSVGTGFWNAFWEPSKALDYLMASWMGVKGMSCKQFEEPCIQAINKKRKIQKNII